MMAPSACVCVFEYVEVLVHSYLCVCHVLTINNLIFACLYLQFNEQKRHTAKGK